MHLLQLAQEEPFQERGLYVIGVEYDILIEELKKHNQARAPVTNPDEVTRDPWDTEWPDTEVSVADTMAKVRVPREILELDASSMVPVGEGQHITRDEYVASRSLLKGSAAASSSTGEVATVDAEAAIRSYEPYKAHDLPSKEERQAAMEMTRKAREKQEAEYQLPEFWAGGWSSVDDMDHIDCIDESLGFSCPESFYPSPEDDRSTWIELTQDQLQKTYPDEIPHWIKTFISGLVRGAFQDPNDPRQPPRWARGHDLSLEFEGTWVNVQDVLNIVNECAQSELGIGSILRMAKHDNKSRFILRGPQPDKETKVGLLAHMMNARILPLQISAAQRAQQTHCGFVRRRTDRSQLAVHLQCSGAAWWNSLLCRSAVPPLGGVPAKTLSPYCQRRRHVNHTRRLGGRIW